MKFYNYVFKCVRLLMACDNIVDGFFIVILEICRCDLSGRLCMWDDNNYNTAVFIIVN